MGYINEKLMQLLRGVRITALKAGSEARVAVGKEIKGVREFRNAVEEVKAHFVSKSMGDMERGEKLLAAAVEKARKVIFNILTQDEMLIKAEMEILAGAESLSEVTSRYPQLKVWEVKLVTAILYNTKRYGEPNERADYKRVEAIIESSEHGKKVFMAEVATLLRDREKASRLLALAMRRDIRREKVDILKLKQMGVRLKALRARFKAEMENSALAELVRDVKEASARLKDAFLSSHDLKKKDTLLVFMVLYDLNEIKAVIEYNIEKNNLPRNARTKLLPIIQKAEADISHGFHTIAQGFRIVIAAMVSLEKRAEADTFKLAA